MIHLRFPTIDCSTSIGGKSIRLRRTVSLRTSARVIARRFSIGTTRRKKPPKLQRKNWRARENSKNRSSRKFCRQGNFILVKNITKNITGRIRNILKHSRKDRVALHSKKRSGRKSGNHAFASRD